MPARNNMKPEAVSWVGPNALAALVEVAAGAGEVVEGDVESDDPKGSMVIVELFWHWSVGKIVAFLVNVISAHYRNYVLD
jgi:hypothetical protein